MPAVRATLSPARCVSRCCAIACAARISCAVIDGMEMDAREDIRAPDLATLDLYCARVASAVGHLSVHVFGDASDGCPQRVAESLGRALQLTNILRDLDEDAGRGRLYLPREILDRHGIARRRAGGGACAIRRCRRPAARSLRSPKRHFRRSGVRDGAVLAPGNAAGRGDGRDLPRDACGAGALGVARSRPSARQPVKAAQALAGAAPRSRMSAGSGTVHVVGAGLAGLAAAVELAAQGRRVQLYEAGRHAGGRCRSYFDAELGCRIDNGNHLLLAGNRAALGYLERIGALDTLEGPRDAAFPFLDAATGRALDRAAEPAACYRGGSFSAKRRVPETRAIDYLAALALRRAGPSATVAEVLDARTRAVPPLVGAARRRRVEHRAPSVRRPGCSGGFSWRRSGEAGRHAGRWCRATGSRKPLSTRRSPACARRVPRSVLARAFAP